MNRCSSVGRRPARGRRALLLAAAAFGVGGPLAVPASAQQARGGGGGDRATGPVNAVATVGMVADAVRAVGGERARVETLIGEGVDPHLHRPTRADTAKMLGAEALFAVGHRLEGRMGDVLDRVRASGRSVTLLAETLPRERLRAWDEYPDAADPHVWMDPALWADASASVATALSRLRPAHAAEFAANHAAYRERLLRLDAYAREALGTVPESGRLLVTAHDAFSYFGARYGLEIASIQGLSTDSEASLAQIEALVAKLVARRVPAVFAETSVPDRAVRALIEGAGARGHRVALGGNLFSDAMGPAGTYEGTLEGMLDHNATVIARALGGRVPDRGLNGRLAA